MSCSDRLANHGQNPVEYDYYYLDSYDPHSEEVCPYCGRYTTDDEPCIHLLTISSDDDDYYYCDIINDIIQIIRSKFSNKFKMLIKRIIENQNQFKNINLQNILGDDFDCISYYCNNLDTYDDDWEYSFRQDFAKIVNDTIYELYYESCDSNNSDLDIENDICYYNSHCIGGRSSIFWAKDPVAVCTAIRSQLERVLVNHMKQLTELLKATRVKDAQKCEESHPVPRSSTGKKKVKKTGN